MARLKKPGRARPTIQVIADRAGVSRATVSLILSNRQEIISRFKPETVLRVQSIAEQVGYQANLTAISLRGRHSSFFGLILRGAGRTDAISWHHQAFEGQFLAGALEASRALNLYPVLATQDLPHTAEALQRMRGVLDGGVFGAVLRTPPPALDAAIQRQIERGLPVVVVFPEDASVCSSNAIDVDNVAVGRAAGKLLQDAGRRRWLLVRDEGAWRALRLREEGFSAAAEEAGAGVEAVMIPSGIAEDDLLKLLASRLRQIRPDGIYAASSVAGVGALLACQQVGIEVPEEACLVGCDASLWRAPGCPAITSVDISWYAAGEIATRKMYELRDRDDVTFENIYLRPQTRPGGTCPTGLEPPAPVDPHD